MKIAILGGTGSIGKGFALRWGQKHDIIVGSRSEERAEEKAVEYKEILKEYGFNDASIVGMDNQSAAAEADVVLLAIRYEQIGSIIDVIKPVLDNQIVVSVVVPMTKDRCYINPEATPLKVDATSREDYNAAYFCYTVPPSGSAAQEIAELLPEGVELVSAFQNVPADKLANLDIELDYDIGVSGNSTYSKNVVFDLARDIPTMRPLDIGPIEASAMIESLTPLVINIAIRNKMKDVGIKFVA